MARADEDSRRFDSNFKVRDNAALQYTKSSLTEGDTLIVIKYPNNANVYDSTGFLVSTEHRVHSEKLLATGSKFFRKNLLDEWLQHRHLGWAKLRGQPLPRGIKYVLSLTPPDEGDDALKLTAQLSCSRGILMWYTAEHRLGVSGAMVGGKDETFDCPESLARRLSNPSASPKRPTSRQAAAVNHALDINQILNADRNRWVQVTEQRHDAAPSYGANEAIRIAGASSPVSTQVGTVDVNGNPARRVTFESGENQTKHYAWPDDPTTPVQAGSSQPVDILEESKVEQAMDYCPIRHRTGIERLLQVIEGKDPRLDSAPKVWTLAVLAKHFDCADAVQDFIFRWLIAEPNSKFMEILPEVTLGIGMMLKNRTITRCAFAVLVSEEALRLGLSADQGPDSYTNFGRKSTRFGRSCEDGDEDDMARIKYAGQAFQNRIVDTFEELVEPKMMWLNTLPEFKKIVQLKEYIDSLDIKPNSDPEIEEIKNTVAHLMLTLNHYVRGRIINCLIKPLHDRGRNAAKDHRFQEQYITNRDMDFEMVYDSLNEDERVMTRFFWDMLKTLGWDLSCTTNLIADPLNIGTFGERKQQQQKRHGIERVTIYNLQYQRVIFNKKLTTAIENYDYLDGKLPDECLPMDQRTHLAVPNLYNTNPRELPPDQPWSSNVIDHTFSSSANILDNITLPQHLSPADPWASNLPHRPAPAPSAHVVFSPSSTSMAHPNLVDVANRQTSGDSKIGLEVNWDDWLSDINATPSSFPSIDEYGRLVRENKADFNSSLFSLTDFLDEVRRYLDRVSSNMLSRGADGEHDWSSTCDTLLCLSDDEYKFLPLWAGGYDDGTGGVFENHVPFADKGPAGPGPGFHTGSTLNSVASGSEIDFDGRDSVFGDSQTMEGVDSSLAVENGYSDHLDRRAVVSVASTSTATMSEKSILDDDEFLNVPDEDEELDDMDWDDDVLSD